VETPQNGDGLRDHLSLLSPSARKHLRNLLIRDQADRDAISSRLLRYRDGPGDDWADIIEMLTMHPDSRRRMVRLLGEIDAIESRDVSRGPAPQHRLGAGGERMATDVVPERASRDSIDGGWGWLRFLLRAAIALLAFLLLALGDDRYRAFFASSKNGRLDNSLWFAWLGWTIGAGIMFGLATWLPFTKLRYLPSRLLLAILALLPVVHFWQEVVFHVRYSASGLIGEFRWFDTPQIQVVCAALAGVAIASGFRADPPSLAKA
jgi:hypothetical protein